MRPHRAFFAVLGLALAFASPTFGQTGYKVEPSKEAPPAGLSDAVKGALAPEGFRVLDGQGKLYAEVWLRKAVPSSEKPGGPKGTIQFPFLADGELIGALRFAVEGHDYRDQAIAKGVYTIRYGLQPVNGDHLGVSPFRDYALLLPAAKDKGVADIARKAMEERSSESAGTSHPACLLLMAAPATPAAPAVARDEAKDTWGAVLPLTLEVKGGGSPSINVQLVVFGVAA